MKKTEELPKGKNENSFSRKQFLKVCGLSAAGAAFTLSSCTEVPNAVTYKLPPLKIGPDPRPNNSLRWLGSGDVGLMNTLHIYTRLEAAFYDMVLKNPYSQMSLKEEAIFSALKNHEKVHAHFFGALLGENAINDVHFDFNLIDFSNRTNVLKAAFRFENYGVSMYNYFPEITRRVPLITPLAKLGSVEARHAVVLQFLLDPEKTFNNRIIGDDGFDVYNSPQAAWDFFSKFCVEGYDIKGLPQ